MATLCATGILSWIGCPGVVAIGAAKSGVESSVEAARAVQQGTNVLYNSTFKDIGAGKNDRFPYRCDQVRVRSTGNPVVDRVREKLSYNDIMVSGGCSTSSTFLP